MLSGAKHLGLGNTPWRRDPTDLFLQIARGDEVSRVIQDAAALAGAGYQVDRAELSEKTGYQLEPAPPKVARGS